MGTEAYNTPIPPVQSRSMRLLQVRDGDGVPRLGIRQGDRTRVLRAAHDGVTDTLSLLLVAEASGRPIDKWLASAESAGALAEADLSRGPMRLTVPLRPPEVWGAGVTYRRSADFREEGTGFYDRVYSAERPELFFKATASRCAGPGEPIGRRRDSAFTAAEPELALVLSKAGTILGYTLANDVSAWDIERDNPLYLPQSKVYDGCFSFGPVIVTPDEIADPYALALECRILRGDRVVFRGEASTAQLKRPYEEIVSFLRRSNAIPTGTVLSTGTGIIQPMEVGLEAGDVVEISCPAIGTLSNTVALV
jgi:2-dehydro-3-deoxy-D-arabinonate dehydratase